MITTPDNIIEAFDLVREYFFGASMGRDNPHRTDEATAQKWIDDGVNWTLAVIVFTEQMSWMHEKFLRFGGGKDRQYLPSSLSVFDDNISAAVRKQRGDEIVGWEGIIWQWRSRCKYWKNNGIWHEDLWGAPPFKEGCRVPREVLAEMNGK